MNTPQKLAYTKPELDEVGSFEEVTLGASTGSAVDGTFTIGQIATFLS
ncbi:lasso RiPP family leader peptide-containing protein [Sphingopyxis sp. H050]|nr:lasso RiPP family leader peptide-containing protein [Sphingopyxis sp. H050]